MENVEKIWKFLKSKGLTDIAAAGVEGNLAYESSLNPKNMENAYEKKLGFTDETYTAAVDDGTYGNFEHDACGYGIAQWTYWTRKANLLSRARKTGVSIGDLNMQLNFMWDEMSSSLKEALNKAETFYEATKIFMLNYEKPADQSEAAIQKRTKYSEMIYVEFANQEEPDMIGVTKFVNDLRQLAAMPTQYDNHYPNNLGYVHCDKEGNVLYRSFDCWNLIKALLNGYDIHNNTPGYYQSDLSKTGDVNGRGLLNQCSDCGKNFADLLGDYPAGTYLFMAETHSGVYVGDSEINGKIYNVIECTAAWTKNVLWSYVDENGNRSAYKGAAPIGKWTDFGLMDKWIDYKETGEIVVPKPIVETPLSSLVPNPTLRKGSKGERVAMLQKCLNILGYLGADMKKLEVDGDFGPNTEFAVRDYQRRNRLEVDGIYGPLTKGALVASMAIKEDQ